MPLRIPVSDSTGRSGLPGYTPMLLSFSLSLGSSQSSIVDHKNEHRLIARRDASIALSIGMTVAPGPISAYPKRTSHESTVLWFRVSRLSFDFEKKKDAPIFSIGLGVTHSLPSSETTTILIIHSEDPDYEYNDTLH